MEMAMIGLGKMGLNMATRLVRAGHRVVGYARSADGVAAAVGRGVDGASSLDDLVGKLSRPRAVWLMLPAGEATGSTLETLATKLDKDDAIIDGGNSNYRATIARAARLRSLEIDFADVGTSGGVWGLTEGYSLMIGGNRGLVDRLRPIFEALAPAADRGWGRVGPHGAGHFVKMVHNGIEYGMMQALAEGFSVLRAKQEFDLDLVEVARIWQDGSVVRSWLLDLAGRALREEPDLSGVRPWIEDSGEGRWAAREAIDLGVAAPILTLALQMRFASRDTVNFAARMVAALRGQFGGHGVPKVEQ